MTSERSSDGFVAFAGFFGAAAACAALTYVVPGLEALRPWLPGDPLPVVAALLPEGTAKVVETESGELVAAAPEPEPEPEVAAQPTPPSAGPPPLPDRPPGHGTALIDPDDRGMSSFYRALHRVAAGEGLARAAHWGDSTIAADGITSTVRARLQARFGDGGPGYLSAGMDPRWNIRQDVTISRSGTWDTVSLLLGGGGGRYGYGGIASTAQPDGSLSITAPKGADGKPKPLQHLEVWYQVGPERGSWWATASGRGVGGGSALAEGTGDRQLSLDLPEGYTRASIGASEGPVTFYGVVMESAGPGVVWDALGVVGVGSRSFTQHGRKHLTSQVAQRHPDLVVVMLGGNELGLPVLGQGDGSAYIPYYTDAVQRLRAGAPEAGCLLISPLDQGTRDGGKPGTKPNLARMITAQKKAAEAEGCAYWDAFAAMGGKDSILRWGATRPPLAWTDLVHLSAKGQEIIGDLLADAIERGYDQWVASGGPSRVPAAVAPPDVPASEAEPGVPTTEQPGAPAGPTTDRPATPAGPTADQSVAPAPAGGTTP